MNTNLQDCIEKARALYNVDGAPPLMQQVCTAFGISLREFASIFGMSKSHAEDIVKHRRFPSLEEAVRITRYFEVSIEELFGWRIDDNGDRRPLLVEDPRTKQVVRLNKESDIRKTMDLVAVRRQTA